MLDFVNPALIESVLSTVFDYFKKRLSTTPFDRARFDFVLDEDIGKTAIEVKSQNVRDEFLKSISSKLSTEKDVKKFILITPDRPTKRQLASFENYLSPSAKEFEWTSLQDFLKKYYDLEINDAKDLAKLQIAAITAKFDNYNQGLIGTKIPGVDYEKKLKENFTEISEAELKKADNLISLRRQFPDSILAKLEQEDFEKLSSQLSIGQRYSDAIVVLTDIKNFSEIVLLADPDDLKEAMSKYYTSARDLVFKYHGVLVQFVGDAVLAIFNYPKKDTLSYFRTTKFCAELISLGIEVFNSLLENMDNAIDTGTRVGVTNGAIYTLNIGKEGIEITFIGDKINFAARLEKKCNVNGILVSNRFHTKFCKQYPKLASSISFKKKKLKPEDAKGQKTITKAWQIDYKDIAKIIKWRTPA